MNEHESFSNSIYQEQTHGLTMMKLVLSGHIDEVVETVEANIRNA